MKYLCKHECERSSAPINMNTKAKATKDFWGIHFTLISVSMVHLSYLYCSTPPICIAVLLVSLHSEEREILSVLLPFVSEYASHLYRSALGKILVVAVTGMFPNLLWVSLKHLLRPSKEAQVEQQTRHPHQFERPRLETP